MRLTIARCNRYYIRSISNRASCWYYDAQINAIRLSDTERTRFRVTIRDGNLPEGTIMVGEDHVALCIGDQHVCVEKSGQLTAGAGDLGDFRLCELESASFDIKDGTVVYAGSNASSLKQARWELAC